MIKQISRRMALVLIAGAIAAPARADTDDAALIVRNPLLGEINRVAPDHLPWYLAQLDAVRHGAHSRGGSSPKKEQLSPAARTALAKNPDVAKAYDVAPDYMAKILQMMLESATPQK